MIRAVLFDLDGTLLDIDLNAFLGEYFAALGPMIAAMAGVSPGEAVSAVEAGTVEMCGDHPGRTNREVFDESFLRATGLDLSAPENRERVEAFYADHFSALRGASRPHEHATRAVEHARSLGMRVALATNPIFPREAVVERMRWAELTPDAFDLVTSYETSFACKPLPRYFRDIAAGLGVEPPECLMVGDDPVLDLAAADVGMKTYFVGGSHPTATWSADLGSLPGLLERISAT